jgi:hypothetical protein
MSYTEAGQTLADVVRAILTGSEEEASAALESPELRDADPAVVRETLEQVMVEEDYPADTKDDVYDKYDSAEDPYAGLQHAATVITNDVDQSLDIHGETHGSVYQENDSNVANATGEGSLAGEYIEGNQTQTGDGQQVGGDSGVQNQGNNSGQQAGYDATADNVTTGDYNTVGSDYANRVGQGQVSQDGAYIDDSAQAFGEGAATNESTDSYDSHDSFSESATATDSFNETYTDDDTNTQTQVIEDHDGGYAPEYEPVFEDDYKIDHDDYEVKDHHDGDDYDQDASIAEVD